jgi:hypothetical protein
MGRTESKSKKKAERRVAFHTSQATLSAARLSLLKSKPAVQKKEKSAFVLGRPKSSPGFCYMCLNGEDLKISCDYCPRALCATCVIIPETCRPKNAVFFCLRCHQHTFGSEPYTVSFFLSSFTLTNKNQGLLFH